MKVLGRYGSGGRSGQVVALADNPANSDLIDKRLDKDRSCAEYDGGMNVIAGSNSGEGVTCGLRQTEMIDNMRDKGETCICCLLQGTGESYLYKFDSTLRNTSPVQK
jgi:hypothetical protein